MNITGASTKGGNMSDIKYTIFFNTLIDMMECYEDMDREDIPEEEIEAKKELIRLCTVIAKKYGGESE